MGLARQSVRTHRVQLRSLRETRLALATRTSESSIFGWPRSSVDPAHTGGLESVAGSAVFGKAGIRLLVKPRRSQAEIFFERQAAKQAA